MDDLISRKAAIDVFLTELTKRERKNLLHTWSTVEVKYFITDMLERLPSVQPEQRSFSCGQENDLISRKAAIDSLRMDISIIPFAKAREYVQAAIEEIHNRLEELPSAQQIIRCRDCRWRKDQSGATAWLPCRAIVTPSDFYCCRAERRGGEQDG